MNILVTGCCGYIGSTLVGHLLRRGHRVTGVDSFFCSNTRPTLLHYLGEKDFTFVEGDVRDRSIMKKVVRGQDVIIPLAALVGAPLCEKHEDLAHDVNHLSVVRLVEWASPDQHIIYPNTNSGYFKGTDVTEDSPLNPATAYGKSKCLAEKEVLSHSNSTVFRLATVFGTSPRMRFDLLVNDFTEQVYRIKKGEAESLRLYEPHFRRNYVHVKDVCRAFINAADGFIPKGVYNLGNPSANLTKYELASVVCDMVGVPQSVIVEDEGSDPDQRDYSVSNARLASTGFSFVRDVTQGIYEVAEACKVLTPDQIQTMRNI